jgi:hypothetical protein
MKRNSRLSIAAAALMLAMFVPAEAGPTAQQELASANYLVGTWDCNHTVGNFAGKYRTTYTKVLGDLWLKQTYDFPPQQAAGREEPAVTAEALMGYEERRQTWVRFFVNSKGQHFAIRMTDTGNGWTWKYVSFFKRTTPETPDPDATFTKKSDTQYLIDGPTYQLDGKQVTEHHVCNKM